MEFARGVHAASRFSWSDTFRIPPSQPEDPASPTPAPAPAQIPEAVRQDVATLWHYHQMGHVLQPADAGIGLGSHDPSVAVVATDLVTCGLFPLIVFTGANSPTTIDRFPRGEQSTTATTPSPTESPPTPSSPRPPPPTPLKTSSSPEGCSTRAASRSHP